MADAPTTPPEDAEHTVSTIQSPPESIGGIIRRLGPGLIIAGSIVGSGELIATTVAGAQAGFCLLWLIIIGCVIKVFAQVEFGRYTIINGRTAMDGMKEVPGPRVAGGNWLLWYWLLMFLVSLGQGGGIIGGVGQALAISLPLSETSLTRNEFLDQRITADVALAQARNKQSGQSAEERDDAEIERLEARIARLKRQIDELGTSHDHKIWAAVVTAITVLVLAVGRYGLIQSFATVLVASFTLITVGNLFALQSYDIWAVSGSELLKGLSFRLAEPGAADWRTPLFTAMAAFGIIGVGSNELIAYPYWCLEKGYARFTGPRDDTPEWGRRAQGWMRVMRWDAWCSMVVYTFATVAFYLLGAAVLGRTGLFPEGLEMIRTLAIMYEPAFGPMSQYLFLFGAFAVLYSTFFVANAGHARVGTDALRVFGAIGRRGQPGRIWIPLLSVVFPTTSLGIYLLFPQPTMLVLAGGFMQFLMLPLLGAATLFFRYRRCDRRVTPGRVWDWFLWISAAGLLLTALSGAWVKLSQLFETPPPAQVQEPPANADQPTVGPPGEMFDVVDQAAPSITSTSPTEPALIAQCRGTARRVSEKLGDQHAVIVRPPFVISGDLPEEELIAWYRRTIDPATRAMAASYFTARPNRPITVLLFRSSESYEQYAAELFGDRDVSVYGYYKPGRRTLVMNIATGGGTLVHELTHALVDFDFPGIPDWFNEGLASLHEQCRFRADGSGIDGLENWRLPGLQKAIESGRLRTLKSLISDDDFRRHDVGLNYAQARYFCLYMQRQGVLQEFYRTFRQRHQLDPLGTESVAVVFADRTWHELDKDFRRWAVQLKR